MSTGRGGSDKERKHKRTERQKAKLSHQPVRTMENRRRRWAKHMKKHPNYLRGMERIKEALGIT